MFGGRCPALTLLAQPLWTAHVRIASRVETQFTIDVARQTDADTFAAGLHSIRRQFRSTETQKPTKENRLAGAIHFTVPYCGAPACSESG
jgi:hypothetical protein